MNFPEIDPEFLTQYRVEIGLAHAIDAWLVQGLNPGGLLTRILSGDYQGAIRCCHPHLLNMEFPTGTPFNNFTLTYCKLQLVLPESVKGRRNFYEMLEVGGLAGDPNRFCEFKLMEFPSFRNPEIKIASMVETLIGAQTSLERSYG